MDILYWLFYTYSRKLSLLPGGQPPNVCSSWNKFKNTGLNRWVIFSHEILRVLFTIQNISRIFSGLNWFNKTHIQLKSCKYKLTLQKLRQGGIHNHRTKAFLIIFGNIFTRTYPYWLDLRPQTAENAFKCNQDENSPYHMNCRRTFEQCSLHLFH